MNLRYWIECTARRLHRLASRKSGTCSPAYRRVYKFYMRQIARLRHAR